MSSLGGEIVGYGIGRKDGTVDYKWLEQPKHNRITQQGMNLLFMLDEDPAKTTSYLETTNSLPALWVGMRDENNTGVLEYCAYGNGQGNTSFFDTDLHNRTSDYVNTKYKNLPYCGTDYETSGNNVIFHYRVSHKFPEVEQNTTIREIGYYSKILVHPETGNEKYIMFSRVLLAEPITIEKGEYIIFTYQMNETVDYKTYKTYTADQFHALGKIREYKFINVDSGTSWDKVINRPFITSNGTNGKIKDLENDVLNYQSFCPSYFIGETGVLKNCVYSDNAYSETAGYVGANLKPSFFNKINQIHISANSQLYWDNGGFYARKKLNQEHEEILKYEINSFTRKLLFNIKIDYNSQIMSNQGEDAGGCFYFFRGLYLTGRFKSYSKYIFETSYDTEDTIAIKQGTFVD